MQSSKTLLAVVSSALLWSGPLLAGAAPSGKVVVVTGQAFVKERRLKVNDDVFAGDVISTREASSVKLFMVDKSILDIGASTTFKVQAYAVSSSGERDVDTELESGTVRASVYSKIRKTNKFYIRTKSSVLAVRGTELVVNSVRFGEERVRDEVTLIHGQVTATPAAGGSRPVEIGAGEQLVVTGTFRDHTFLPSGDPGNGPRVAKLSPSQLSRILEAGRVNDKTFLKNIVVGGTPLLAQSTDGVRTLSSVVAGQESQEPLAGVTLAVRDVPQAVGQDFSNGSSAIPGYCGIPGGYTPTAVPTAPWIPVQIAVVFHP
jgi:hypothetical protein